MKNGGPPPNTAIPIIRRMIGSYRYHQLPNRRARRAPLPPEERHFRTVGEAH
jgi:hypothetical protein